MKAVFLAGGLILATGYSDRDQGGFAGVEQEGIAAETLSDPILVQVGTAFETNPPPIEIKPENPREQEGQEGQESPKSGQDRSGEQDPKTGDDANPEQFEPESGY